VIAYDDFKLTTTLGSLFRYYTSDGFYFREALNELALWTQTKDAKLISKTVYDLAHRTAVKADA